MPRSWRCNGDRCADPRERALRCRPMRARVIASGMTTGVATRSSLVQDLCSADVFQPRRVGQNSQSLLLHVSTGAGVGEPKNPRLTPSCVSMQWIVYSRVIRASVIEGDSAARRSMVPHEVKCVLHGGFRQIVAHTFPQKEGLLLFRVTRVAELFQEIVLREIHRHK